MEVLRLTALGLFSCKRKVLTMNNIKLVMDTREQQQHIREYAESIGLEVIRKKLDYGDYALMVDEVIQPFTVERKNGVQELVSNFSKGLSRFEREFERADGSMGVVCEGIYQNIADHNYQYGLAPRYIVARIKRFTKDYKVDFHFVPTDSAKFIIDLLLSKVAI